MELHSEWLYKYIICCLFLDINECTTDNGGCDHTCINEAGSYHCDCEDGFELDEDLHGCSGIYDMRVYYVYFNKSKKHVLLKEHIHTL